MKLFLSLFLVLLTTFCFAQKNHKVGQKDKKFTQDKVVIKVGDTIEFVNEDVFFHNVFSLSDAALFDLGSFPQGESKKVTFEEAGVVEVECAIHPSMVMEVVVE